MKALEKGLNDVSAEAEPRNKIKRWTGDRRLRGDRRERLRELKRHARLTKLIQQGKRARRRGPDWYERLEEEVYGTDDEQIERALHEIRTEDRIEQLERQLRADPNNTETAAELSNLRTQLAAEDAVDLERAERFDRLFWKIG
jgi:hypothetical protein